MSAMERLFVEILDRKSRIDRQLYQQLESYGESLACNLIADGRRPPPWLLELGPAATACLDREEYGQPSSSFWDTKRKTCSATWEFIQGTLPRVDSDFKSSIHEFVIAENVDIQNKSPHVVEEIRSACSRDEIRPTNLMAFESENNNTSKVAENLFKYVNTFENTASEDVVFHDGSEEGEEPSNALQHLYGSNIIGTSGKSTVKLSCDETMTEFNGSNTELPYVVADNISYKDDDIPSLANELTSTTPHVDEEFLCVRIIDEVELTNSMPFESQIDHTYDGSEKKISDVDTFENNACESLDHYDVPEMSKEPYNVTQHLHGCAITVIPYTAAVNSSCDEAIPDFKGSSIDLPNTVEVNFTKDADISTLPKERASATPLVVEEILSVCSRNEVRASNLVPCESEIHHTSHSSDKLVLHLDTFESKASQTIGDLDGFEESKDPYDAKQRSCFCDATISDITVVKSTSDETILEFEGSSIDLPYSLEDNIVIFEDVGIPSLAEQASTTPHVVEEILNSCLKDEVRPANIIPFGSEIHQTSQGDVEAFENKASESFGHHAGSEEGEEPYAPYICDITSISDTVGINTSCDENMPDFEEFIFDLPYEEDNIVCNDVDIPSLEKERAFVLEQLRQSRIFVTPNSKPSMMNRIDIISDGFNSSPLGILQNMDLGFSLEHNNPDTKHFTSSSIKLMDMFCNDGSQLDGPAFESLHSLSSLSARFDSELQNLPLTPPAIKLSHGRLSGKRSSSPVKVSSNSGLFPIDENFTTTEENVDSARVGYSSHRASSRHIEVPTNSKPLSDVTSLYQNDACFLSNLKEFVIRDSLGSVNSDAASSLGFEFAGRESDLENKENPCWSDAIKELLKTNKTDSKMSGRTRVSCRSSDRIKNYQNTRKGCKPSNLLSSISSFIPQIQQKQQQALPLQRKKDIKVKALEAAEAAKRLEDQLKIEREKRKAAMKIEREKLKQENAKLLKLKQKQKDEDRRKRDDVAARKRQREAEERKFKDRKRRCIEETRTLQKEHKDKSHCEKAEKDIRQKAIYERQKGIKQRINGGQKKLERGVDATESQMAAETQHWSIQITSTDTMLSDDKIQALEDSDEHAFFEKGVGSSNVLREMIKETVPTQISLELQSYDMSPYQTSDDEDMEDDSQRKKKYIPLWARGERLGEILLANQQLDPKDIFSRKRSFNVSEVLTTRVLWRRPLK